MKYLFLCAGRPHTVSGKPTYMLTCPDGNYVLEKIVEVSNVDPRDCIFAIREKDDLLYNVEQSFKELFGPEVTCVTIKSDNSAGPLQTVVKTIHNLSLKGPLLIRDTDSYFETKLPKDEGNYLTYANLDDCPNILTRNLSFLKINDQGVILDIQERHSISNLFATGAYAFEEAAVIPKMYERLKEHSPHNMYVSECVKEAIFYRRDAFLALPVKGFIDWGAERSWHDWCSPQKTLFVDMDGVLCTNGGRSFKPRQIDAQPIEENIEVLRKRVAEGAQVIITTSRPESFREETEAQLTRWNFPYNTLVMGCLHQQRIIINDYSRTNKYPSAVAVNIQRNGKELKNLL